VVGVVVDAQRPPLDANGNVWVFGHCDQSGDTCVVDINLQAMEGVDADQQGECSGEGFAVSDDDDPAAWVVGDDVGEAGVGASEVRPPGLTAPDQWSAGRSPLDRCTMSDLGIYL
jgi:hypothetical protein